MAKLVNELSDMVSIPIELVYDSRLSDRSRFVYCYMSCMRDGSELVLERMCEDLGYSVATLKKYISELLDSGWLCKGVGGAGYILRSSLRVEKTNFNTKNENFNTKIDFEAKNRGNHNIDNLYIPTIYENIINEENNNNDNDNNYDNNIEEKIKEKNSQKKEKKQELFLKCWVAYRRKGSRKKSLEQWERLSDKERMLVMPHIRAYVGSRDLVYQRDFERYLRDKVFMDTIVVGKRVVYDPSHVTNDTDVVYRPMTDGMIHWNDGLGCYLFTGFDETCIFDGYDDANRPDGAMLCMNNGRGYVSWDAKARKWVRKSKP